jgi:hypothetical protein
MTFEDQLKALIFFHLEEHTSGSHLVKVFQEDDFARQHIAPEDGIKKSTFFEAINERGLEQLEFLKNSKKTKLHVGFDLNHAIPAKTYMAGIQPPPDMKIHLFSFVLSLFSQLFAIFRKVFSR